MIRQRLSCLMMLAMVIGSTDVATSQDSLLIWREFMGLVRTNQLPVSRIRPHAELGDAFRQTILGYLDSIRAQASPEDWTAEPEIIRTENRFQYILPWSARDRKVSYCFSFIIEHGEWYFQHLEAVFIRLDKVTHLPASEFPDVSEAQKHWAREEIYWSFVIINYFLPIAKEHGDAYALDMLKDGAGYFLGAKTWVPFAPPHKAFILYLCWEQSRLRGNEVTLARLDDTAAIVTLDSHFFALYFAAGHLKPVISLDRYKRMFETIWQDRAAHAGWNLEMEYADNYRVTFHFTRSE